MKQALELSLHKDEEIYSQHEASSSSPGFPPLFQSQYFPSLPAKKLQTKSLCQTLDVDFYLLFGGEMTHFLWVLNKSKYFNTHLKLQRQALGCGISPQTPLGQSEDTLLFLT